MWIFSRKDKTGVTDKTTAGEKRITNWRSGRIKKEFNLRVIGGFADPFRAPPPETHDLPAGWSIDKNGFYTCHLPQIDIGKADFADGERASFPAYMTAARLSKPTSDTRFLMSADKVAMKFHHWMGANVPGFWDVFNYERRQNHDKVFRLVIDKVADITFYSTHGGYNGKHANRDEQGATFVVKTPDSTTHRLIYESNIANPHRDLCYPGHRDKPHVGFTLPPDDVVVDNLVSAFGMVRAIGRAHEEGRLDLAGSLSLSQGNRAKSATVAKRKKGVSPG